MVELDCTTTKKAKYTGERCKKFKYTNMVILVRELVKDKKYREACFLTLALNTSLTSNQILSLKVSNFVVPGYITGEGTDGKGWTIKLGNNVWELVDGYLSNTDWVTDRNNGDSLLFRVTTAKDGKQIPLCESTMFANINSEIRQKFYMVDSAEFGSVNNKSIKSIYWSRFNKYWEKQQERNPYVGNVTMGLSADAFKK